MNKLRFMFVVFVACVGLITILGSTSNGPKSLVSTGGSKADGTVELSYEYRDYERPTIQWEQAYAEAKRRCELWGYSDTEKFGGETRSCIEPSRYGCLAYYATVKFQCHGAYNSKQVKSKQKNK